MTGQFRTETEARYTTNQLTICHSTEYYNKENQKCEACPADEGTTSFQQRTCQNCGNMWFNEQDEPNSIEMLTAAEICENPQQVYVDSILNKYDEV